MKKNQLIKLSKNDKKINIKDTNLYKININLSFKNSQIHLFKYDNNTIIKQWSTQSLKKIERRKNTKYNMELIINDIINFILKNNLFFFKIYVRGRNFTRHFFLKKLKRMVKSNNIFILSIIDNSSIPFNGCRPKKQKRR